MRVLRNILTLGVLTAYRATFFRHIKLSPNVASLIYSQYVRRGTEPAQYRRSN